MYRGARPARYDSHVTFAAETDQTWYIVSLLFRACGEITCGFFILGNPCQPKIVSESGLRRKFKQLLGLSLKSSVEPTQWTLTTVITTPAGRPCT